MTVRNQNKSLGLYILITWLLCGTLDMLSAIIINPKVPAAAICRYIASGLVGKETAYSGGTQMVVYGLLLHYLIALVFTFILFKLYPYFKGVLKFDLVLILVFGLLIWAVMNLVIVPLSHTPKFKGPMNVMSMIKNMLALIVAFGIPITFIGKRFYR